ncbi:unnamed protein product, partial [Nesidiocoris tenuis]
MFVNPQHDPIPCYQAKNAEKVLELSDATATNATRLSTNASVPLSPSTTENSFNVTANTPVGNEYEVGNYADNDTATDEKMIFSKEHYTNFVTVKTESSDESEQDVTTSKFPTSPTTPIPTLSTAHTISTSLPTIGVPGASHLNASFPSKFEPVIKQPLVYSGSQFPSKPVRLEPAPVTEEVEDFSPFEANKQSILQWIASLLANYGFGNDQSTVAPEPIDQSKCKPCDNLIIIIILLVT